MASNFRPTLNANLEKSCEEGRWHGRRQSQETSSGDSGFFNGPSPNSVYSQDSSFSSSSLASPQSSTTSRAQNFPDLYAPFTAQKSLPAKMLDDLDLEQIVDDVDNLYRYCKLFVYMGQISWKK